MASTGSNDDCVLFVAGGGNFGTKYNDVELVDLCANGTTSTCPKPADLPRGMYEGSGLRTTKGNPLACGGEYDVMVCQEYVKESDSWVDGPEMMGSRVDTTAVELTNGSFWIMGSYTGDDVFTTEILVDDGFISGPDLPTGNVGYPCSTQVTDDITFYGNQFGFLFDSRVGEFVETDMIMPHTAYKAACGAATLPTGERLIVVAGGYDEVTVQSRVQVFSMKTRTWTEGPPLPSPLEYGLTVNIGETFFIVGGRDEDEENIGTILEFDVKNMAWITREETLSMPRALFYMITVEKDRFC